MNGEERLSLARLSLEGLSVGDAFGQSFFSYAAFAPTLIQTRRIAPGPWMYTDDTNMALSIYETLRLHGEINQDALALSFARHYALDRGYGPAMHRLLAEIDITQEWRGRAAQLFDGQGSYGNGAAMRIAPLGAYFADDLDRLTTEAVKASEITHTHPEGILGGLAVALAAAYAVRLRGAEHVTRQEFISSILPHLPESEVKSGLRRASELQSNDLKHVVEMIGNGRRITAQDTVPFTLWCVGESIEDFERALWITASAYGDIDTNCAIVGGIVALYTGFDKLPHEWIEMREPLPDWALI